MKLFVVSGVLLMAVMLTCSAADVQDGYEKIGCRQGLHEVRTHALLARPGKLL